jgi:hypothetical protein
LAIHFYWVEWLATAAKEGVTDMAFNRCRGKRIKPMPI